MINKWVKINNTLKPTYLKYVSAIMAMYGRMLTHPYIHTLLPPFCVVNTQTEGRQSHGHGTKLDTTFSMGIKPTTSYTLAMMPYH